MRTVAHSPSQIPSPDLVAQARESIMELAPESMRAQFGVMVELALSQMPADSLSQLIADLKSAHNDDGSINPDRLIVVGKSFGLTDEMISGYQASFGALAQ